MTDVAEKVDDETALTLSRPARVLLAACLIGAGGIHLAMVPSHASEWLAEGLAFAVAGWLQVALAILILTRPSPRLLGLTAIANLVFLAAWSWTRTVGAPFGPEAGAPHDAGFVDGTCALLEFAVVIGAVAALSRPTIGSGVPRRWLAPLAILPLGVLALSTAAIASPSASGHAHEEAASGHAHGEEATGEGEPHGHTASDDETEGDEAAAGPGHDDGHGHGVSADAGPVDDRGLALLENGEMAHDYGPDQPLDADARALLVHQLELTRHIAERFPTLADATAAGSEPAGGFAPGQGIHMSTPTSGMPAVPAADPSVPTIPGTLSDAEIMRPSNLLYDGITDDARLAGFMYYSLTMDEPEGFAGPNDHWHTHGSLCINMAGAGGRIEVLHPAELTTESCAAIDGFFVERTNYMVHVWTVPGYESNRGVFSDINPAIACPDGTYYTVSEDLHDRYRRNKCLSNPA